MLLLPTGLFEKLSKDFESEHGYRMEFTADKHGSTFMSMLLSSRKFAKAVIQIFYGYAQHQGSFA